MGTEIADLRLKPWLLVAFNQLGYEVVGDMQHLSAVETRIAGMVGTVIGKP